MLREAYSKGRQAALEKFGLAQPPLKSIGIKPAVKAPDLPPPPKNTPSPLLSPSLEFDPSANPVPTPGPSLGMRAAKIAENVGMGALTGGGTAGGVRGEPADEGRRQRSVVDRTFQQNEDFFASSSMPAPGGQVSP